MQTIINFKKKHVLRMFLLAVVGGYFGIVLYYVNPLFTGFLIDNIVVTHRSDLVLIWLCVGLVFGLFLHAYLFYFLKYIWDKYATFLSNEVRNGLSERVLNLQPYYYEKYNHGFVFNLFFSDASTIGGVTLTYVASSILAILRIVTCVVILLLINTKLTFIGLAFIPLYIWAMFVNRSKLGQASSLERKSLDSLVFFVRKLIEGKVHINLFQKGFYFRQLFEQHLGNWTKQKLRYSFWFNLTKEIPQLISTIAPFVVLAFGANLVIKETLTLGRLIMFSQYVSMLFEPLNILSQAIVEKKATAPIFERVLKFLHNDSNDSNTFPHVSDDALVTLKNCEVLNKDQTVLFSVGELTIIQQGLYIFSGDNGVGKTTLLNFFSSINNPELLKPTGTDSMIHLHQAFQEQMAYLYQPGFLFEGSVRENITFGEKSNESLLQEIVEVLGIKNLDKEISFNPVNLSLGEQQKIFLARTFFCNKNVILLDEPLSNLDFDAKKRLREYLRKLKTQKTFLIVTHDVELKHMADTCFVIKENRINVLTELSKIS